MIPAGQPDYCGRLETVEVLGFASPETKTAPEGRRCFSSGEFGGAKRDRENSIKSLNISHLSIISLALMLIVPPIIPPITLILARLPR